MVSSCLHRCTPVRRRAPPARPPPHSSSSPAAAPTLLAAMRAPPGAAVCPFHRRAGGCGRARRGVRRHEGRWRLWDVLLLAWRRRREPAELAAGARNRQAGGACGGEQGARQHASKRSAMADRCASRRSPWWGEPTRSYRRGGTGVRPGGAAPALPTRPTSATRPLIRGASAPWPPGRWRRGVGRRRRGVGGGGRRADARGPGQGLGKIREVIEGERRRKDGGGR